MSASTEVDTSTSVRWADLIADEAEVDALVEWVMQPVVAQVYAAVETGRRLRQVKETREHGTWLAVLKEMPFSEQTAQRYMRGSTWFDSLPNTSTWTHLPTSYRSLAALASVPPSEVPALIASGAIRSDMTVADATELAQQYQAGRQALLGRWIECTDGLTAALAYFADGYRPPDNLTDSYVSLATLTDRAIQLLAHLEACK